MECDYLLLQRCVTHFSNLIAEIRWPQIFGNKFQKPNQNSCQKSNKQQMNSPIFNLGDPNWITPTNPLQNSNSSLMYCLAWSLISKIIGRKKWINGALKEAQWHKCAESVAEKYPKYSKFLLRAKLFCLPFSDQNV